MHIRQCKPFLTPPRAFLAVSRSIDGKPGRPLPRAPAAEWTDRRKRKRINAREGTRVLVIDDLPTIVAALRKILRS